MTKSTRPPRTAVAMIAGVVAAGAAAVAIRLPEIGRWTRVDLAALCALATATLLGEALSVKVRFGRETKNVTLTETAYAAALLVGVRSGVLTAAVVLGVGVAYLARGTTPHKVAFNAASYALAVTAAEVIFTSMHAVSPLGAIVLAMGAFFLINASTVVGVIALATGTRFADVFRPIARLEGTHAVGNTALGAFAASVWVAAPVAMPALVVASAIILLGYRALSRTPTGLLAR